ncbi:MAG: type II toxin-antitoxin system VapC family toxin [Propionibacteriaceae bacterium]|jgi:predicted nucleic-acid-binding protein|nr:type II toxin-antitoxin system VapC family toxin [Propionibacteriaceae bacterium]
MGGPVINADTNVLIRAALKDDPVQGELAADVLRQSDQVAVTIPTLCEFAWVLRRGYKKTAVETATAIRRLIAAPSIVIDKPAAEAGLAVLDLGGDFADGAIACLGEWLGASELVTFDKQAVKLLAATGHTAKLLG